MVPRPPAQKAKKQAGRSSQADVDAVVAKGLMWGGAAILVILMMFALLELIGQVGTILVLMSATAGGGYAGVQRVWPPQTGKGTTPADDPGISSSRSSARPTKHARAQGPEDASRNDPPTMRFYPPGSVTTVAGRDLVDALVYVGSGDDAEVVEPSRIDLSLPVDSSEDLSGLKWPAPPAYRRISPGMRAAYLDWLAGTRRAAGVDVGMINLYLLGLERRVLLDERDHGAVLKALIHLLNTLGDRHGAVRRHITSLAWQAVARSIGVDRIKPKRVDALIALQSRWTTGELNAALSWWAWRNKAIPAALAWAVCLQDPRCHTRLTAAADGSRLRSSFDRHWNEAEAVSGSADLVLNDKPLVLRHELVNLSLIDSAASQTLSVTADVPNPLACQDQFEPWTEIWLTAADEAEDPEPRPVLEPPVAGPSSTDIAGDEAGDSDASALNVSGFDTVSLALTKEVLPSLGAWSRVCETYQDPDDPTVSLLPVSELASLLGIKFQDPLSHADTLALARTADKMGYAIEPDPRIHHRDYKWTQRIAVFMSQAEVVDIKLNRYRGASLLTLLGTMIASADGRVHTSELQVVADHIQSHLPLARHEKERLRAYRLLLTRDDLRRHPLDRGLVQTMTRDDRERVSEVLLAIAAADGVVTTAERRVLRSLYQDLELDPEAVDQRLAAWSAQSSPELPPEDDDPRALKRPAASDPALSAPDRGTSKPEVRFVLDRDRIEKVMENTRSVAQVLTSAMDQADAEEPEVETPEEAVDPEHNAPGIRPLTSAVETPGTPGSFAGMPERFVGFARALIARTQWSPAELRRLADDHKVMTSAAVEAINEWSHEQLGDWLVDDTGTNISVEVSLLSNIPETSS